MPLGHVLSRLLGIKCSLTLCLHQLHAMLVELFPGDDHFHIRVEDLMVWGSMPSGGGMCEAMSGRANATTRSHVYSFAAMHAYLEKAEDLSMAKLAVAVIVEEGTDEASGGFQGAITTARLPLSRQTFIERYAVE